MDAGYPVNDRVDEAADCRGDNRAAARHSLERNDPERLVPRCANDDVARAQERRHVLPLDPATQLDAVVDTEPFGPRGEARRFRLGPKLVSVSAAGDDELDAGEVGQSCDNVADPLALDEPRDDDDARVAVPASVHGPVRAKEIGVDPARNDCDATGVGAESDELEDLVGAGGDKVV